MLSLPAPPLLGLIAAAKVFTSPFYNTVYISHRLILTPDELRGCVNSVACLNANGLAPLGLALAAMTNASIRRA